MGDRLGILSAVGLLLKIHIYISILKQHVCMYVCVCVCVYACNLSPRKRLDRLSTSGFYSSLYIKLYYRNRLNLLSWNFVGSFPVVLWWFWAKQNQDSSTFSEIYIYIYINDIFLSWYNLYLDFWNISSIFYYKTDFFLTTIVYGHTMLKTPVLVWSLKLSNIGLS